MKILKMNIQEGKIHFIEMKKKLKKVIKIIIIIILIMIIIIIIIKQTPTIIIIIILLILIITILTTTSTQIPLVNVPKPFQQTTQIPYTTQISVVKTLKKNFSSTPTLLPT